MTLLPYENIIIRHAEKDPKSGDVLSEKGRLDAYNFGRKLAEWYNNQW